MSRIGDFLLMTRRERVGAMVVVLLIVLVIIAVFLIRSCSSQKVSEISVSELEQFEQETDSAVQQLPNKGQKSPKNKKKDAKSDKKKDGKKKSSKKAEKKKSVSEPNRSLDPVPTF